MKAKHLVVTKHGTLHDRRHATEQCNLDDADELRPIYAKEWAEHQRSGYDLWRLCAYCYPE